MAFLPRDAL